MGQMELLAITRDGLARVVENAAAWHVEVVREESRAQCLALDPRDPEGIYLGTRGRGVWKSTDGGVQWVDLSLPEFDVFALAVSRADGAVYAGTEPSKLFKSTDGGATWHELDGLQDLPSRDTWSFPPRPHTSHVRWIAPHPVDAGRLLVGIELGGLMLSRDGGVTWADHRPGARKDVHAVLWHPRDPTRAYEAGGGGAAFSRDGGQTWEAADAGRDRHYTWGLAVDPEESDTWYVSASPGPRQAHGGGHAQAFIYRRTGDQPWEALGGGLPQPLNSFPYALLHAGGCLFAGLGDGRLWASKDGGDTWVRLPLRGATLAGLKALAFAG